MSIQAGTAYQFLLEQGFSGNHDIENDVLFFAMYTTLADIDPVTADLQTSLSDELVGSGYVAGGQQLTQTVIYTSGQPNRPVLDFDDLVFGPGAKWGVTNEAAQGGVIYNTTAGAQQDKICWIVNFGSPQVVNNGTFTVVWPDPTNPSLAMVRTIG